MLTSDLLVTRISKGKIEPIYASLDQEHFDIASSVIDIFQSHVGRTYGELEGELEGIEEINYRLIRGLAQILERRCVIDQDAVIDPITARRKVFEESRGFITGIDERKDVLNKVAGNLSLQSDDLEKALWADQQENLVIKGFQTMPPEDLIGRYNLSLTQTLLFKATGMEIQIENNYQEIFRKIKQLGLIYSILDDKVYLDGPISLFKLTEKYGIALAKLLPAVIASPRWSLKATILRKTTQGKRIYDFYLDHKRKEIFGEELGKREIIFDSAIEKDFYELTFNGWIVRREPTVLKAGQYAFIPDFSLERNGTRIYVEIVGFWTPEYLKNKIWKIDKLEKKENLILLVNRSLGCSGSEFKTDNLIFYDKKVPHLEIIKILRKYEEKQLTEELTKMRNIEISIDSSVDIISLDKVAGKYGISLEALKEVLKDQNKTGYLLLGDQLVGNQILKTIQGELDGIKKHDDALRVFERYGLKAHSQALTFLGYKVKWNGLSPENAEIVKL